jgi:hypothetical protein
MNELWIVAFVVMPVILVALAATAAWLNHLSVKRHRGTPAE